MQNFLEIIRDNRAGKLRGIYAVCTAQPLALEAALLQGKQDGTPILVEATANQVNQFGGYTGMTPADFIPFIKGIAKRVGFPVKDLILGGDHLGPVAWSAEPAGVAMDKARGLVAAYVLAGFKKIHLDTSMACAGDDSVLSDEIVAMRAALFALSSIEEELIHPEHCAGLKRVCEQVMLCEPKYWKEYYTSDRERLLRRYSYSDRIRYYWNHPLVADAVDKLLTNLADTTIPLPLLSQYLPRQYAAIRAGELTNHPRELVIHNIMQVTGCYASACWKQQASE